MHTYLRAKMEVAQKDGSLGARNYQDDKYQEKKAEHIVHLTRPEI